MKKLTLSFFFIILYSWVWGQCSTTANFTYTYTACSTIQFTDASTASANYNLVQWQWNFGVGDTATGQIVTHTFTPGDTVQVQLVVTADSSGVTCTNTVVKQIVVHALPTVYAGSNHNPSCVVVAANFFGHSGMEPYIKSWQWDFGDGTFDTLQNPVHLYPDTGSYKVILHVIDSNSCANNSTPYIQKVNPLSAMNFTWNVDPAAVVDNLQFTSTVDTSYGSVTSWHWDFGDGDTANIQNPTHQYSAVGQYSVTLSIVVDGFCPNSLTKTVTIDPLPAPNFTVSPVCLNDTTFFTDLSTTPVGTIQTWKWYFGDGDSLIVNRPGNPNVKHIYSTQTVYPVKLLTINSSGYERSFTKEITVVPKPLADFTFNDTCYTLATSFFDQSFLEGGSAISSWNWNFGDPLSGAADSSLLQNPTHVISVPGTYPVRLIIENTDGCMDTTVRSVVMDSLPVVEFTMPQDSICLNQKAPFYGIGKDITSWHWDFGNGDTSAYQNPVYQYLSPGLYKVTLTVKDLKGCSSSISHKIFIKTIPQPDFTFTILCNGDTTCFMDQSSISKGYIKQWKWSFGDGSTDTIQNPTHLYQPIGQYYATLYVTSDKSCTNSVSKIIIFDSLPSPNFSVSPACLNDTTFFTDLTTTPVGTIQSWKWYFGDGDSLVVNSPDNPNVKHIYGAETSYNVTLLTISTFGFERSITKQITVNRKPLAAFTFNDTCYTRPIFFTDLSDSTGGTALSTWNWNFGDPVSGIANTSSLQDPTHIMSSVDTFNVRLIVTNIAGCQDTSTRSIVVDSLLTVDFSMQKDSVCFGQPLFFAASYTPYADSIASYTWNFNDGSQPTTTYHDTISHIFPHPGVYNVELSAADTNGCFNTVTHQAIVDSLPVPGFTYVTPDCDQPTYFTDLSREGGNFISTWQWDFGDASSGAANYSGLPNPSHLYISNDSLYQVKLIISNFNGCVDSITKPVNRNSCLSVLYTVSTGTGCANNTIYFIDRGLLSATRGNVTQWEWNFGDGNRKTYKTFTDSVAHVFKTKGSYLVTLTVTADVNGRPFTRKYDSTIVIALPPIANFTVSNACSAQTVYFTDSTETFGSNLTRWQWGFDDPGSSQNSSSLQNPEHLFVTVANYLVQLVVTDDNNCRDTVTRQVAVHPTPQASFDVRYNYNGITGQILMNNTTVGAVSYLWDFGDGSISTEENPIYRYTSADIFHIMLIATSQYQCPDTATTVYNLTSGLYVPNSFVPGSDVPGINLFKPKGVHLKKYRIEIFSTWGTLLWKSSKLSANGEPVEGWDGTYQGKPMPAGNYVWRIKAKFLDNTYWQGSDSGDGNVKPYGTVTLIR